MRHLIGLPLLLALLSTAQPLGAQRAAVSLLPRAGVLTQPGPLTMRWDAAGPEFREDWQYRFQPAPVVGAALEVRARGLPFPVRIEANHAPALTLKHRADRYGPPLYQDSTARVSTLTAAAVLEAERFCRGGVCPRLILGAGGKRYRFDAHLLWDDVVDRFADDQTRAALQVGVGLAAARGPVSFHVEANDFSNRVRFAGQGRPSGRVHDTLVTVGIGVPLR